MNGPSVFTHISITVVAFDGVWSAETLRGHAWSVCSDPLHGERAW